MSKRLVLSFGTVFVLLLISYISFISVKRYFYFRTIQDTQSTLRLVVAGLRGELSRFKPLPSLIADNSKIKALLSNQTNQELLASVHSYLKQVTKTVGASDIYVMNETALTIAASNYDSPISFVNRNFGYRPYFQQAIKGGLGRYFAYGSTSKKRGYYFSAPVIVKDKILGVVVVKVSIDDFETAWRGNDHDIIVTDNRGIIFISSQKEWLFRSLFPISKQVLDKIKTSRQYPINTLKPLKVSQDEQINQQLDDHSHLRTLSLAGAKKQYISRHMKIPSANWTVHILTPTTNAISQTYLTVFTIILLFFLGVILLFFQIHRRKTLMDRIHTQREAQAQLEENVRNRTADLNAANENLTKEVDERIQTEKKLRQTQQDLIQAGKLAALGQMSAALSHEFNQPLSAMRSYTENAATYLERGRINEAKGNINRISELIGRMTAISKHLRNFARKPEEKIGAVPLATVLNDAIEIMSGKLKINAAKIKLKLPNDPIWVRGGKVRLQQVIVNLISNALDAMNDLPTKTIEVFTETKTINQQAWVCISIRDYGKGFEDDVIEKIFDPFFSTKLDTKGLGLGLSISYNIIKDFGGQLSAYNHAEGGAVIVIKLLEAETNNGVT